MFLPTPTTLTLTITVTVTVTLSFDLYLNMRLVDLHVPTNRRSLALNSDLRSLKATQAKRTAASDLPLRYRGGRKNTIFDQ